MSYVIVEDFRGGLDRRRMRAVGQPGTLWECVNAHITRGGEVEKRKKFVAKYALPAASTFGLGAAASVLHVFGGGAEPVGMPAGVTYQRLQHPDGLAMTAVLDAEVFDGLLYVIAEYSDGSVHHFYDGTRVADWDSGVVRAAMTDNDGIAEHLKALIDAHAAYVATRAGAVITITAAVAGTPFTISADTENVDGGTDDQAIALAQTVPNIAGISEVLSTASFSITGGTASAGVNMVTSVKVNGVEVLGANVDWTTSHSGTATNVAAQIVTFNSTPEYTASADGAVVTISAVAASGATPNGFTVSVTVAGDVTASTPTAMAGGVTAVSGQAQVYTATVSGTFEVDDKFTITIDDNIFGNSGNPASKGRFALTYKSKMHALAGSIDYYSGINDPTLWNIANTGAGFQNMANEDSGSETLVSVGKFQGNLVFFARRAAQVWHVEVDDSNNVLLQNPENTGTPAANSVLSYGDTDLFYLSDSGVRSIRQAQGTSNVVVNDVGTAIDTIVTAQMRDLTDSQIAAAAAIIEPVDNRFWLALDNQTYVFSFFPASKISAWSTYETGVVLTDFRVIGTKVYARSGDTIYLYGGDDGNTYDADASDLYTVTVSTPFLSAGKIATDKYVVGFNLAVEGTWTVNLLHDPNNTSKKTRLGIVSNGTYRSDDLGASGYGPLFAVEMICTTAGAARIANFSLDFREEPKA